MPAVFQNNMSGAMIAAGAAAGTRARGYQRQTQRLAQEQAAQAQRQQAAMSQAASILQQMFAQKQAQEHQQEMLQQRAAIQEQQVAAEQAQKEEDELWEHKWSVKSLEEMDAIYESVETARADPSIVGAALEEVERDAKVQLSGFKKSRRPRGERKQSIEEQVAERSFQKEMPNGTWWDYTIQPDGKMTGRPIPEPKADSGSAGSGYDAKRAKAAEEAIRGRMEHLDDLGAELPIPADAIAAEINNQIQKEATIAAELAQLKYLRDNGMISMDPGSVTPEDLAAQGYGSEWGAQDQGVGANAVPGQGDANEPLPFDQLPKNPDEIDPNQLWGPRNGWYWKFNPMTGQLEAVRPEFGG